MKKIASIFESGYDFLNNSSHNMWEFVHIRIRNGQAQKICFTLFKIQKTVKIR
jgi:hypothetical protein